VGIANIYSNVTAGEARTIIAKRRNLVIIDIRRDDEFAEGHLDGALHMDKFGETFEADISIGAYSSDLKPENIRLTVNGTGLKIGNDGIAKFSEHASSTGKRKLDLVAQY